MGPELRYTDHGEAVGVDDVRYETYAGVPDSREGTEATLVHLARLDRGDDLVVLAAVETVDLADSEDGEMVVPGGWSDWVPEDGPMSDENLDRRIETAMTAGASFQHG